MSYETPAWASNNGAQVPVEGNRHKTITIDVHEFVRTRDALTSAYIGLSSAVDRAVKAYLDHTGVVLNGGAALDVSGMLAPLHNTIGSNVMLAQQAYQNAGMPMQQQMYPQGPVVEEKKAKRTKRAYKQRDRNAPKRPLTAYFRFLGEQRPEIQAECAANPEIVDGRPGDISKIATDRWNALSKEQQQPYRDAYQKALKDYHKEVSAYKASIGEDVFNKDLPYEKNTAEEGTAAGAAGVNSNEGPADDDDDSDSSSDSEDEEEVAAPPPPPPAPAAKPPRSALKKKTFSSIEPEPASEPAAFSPDLKRKSPPKEDTGRKSKKSRKSGISAVAGPDVSPAPASDSAVPSFSPEATQTETGSKKKEKKKKRRDA